jgi:hypothetical protein
MQVITFEGIEYTVSDWVRFVARDRDGLVCGFARRPVLTERDWMPNDYTLYEELQPNLVAWEESLVDLGDPTPDPTDHQLYARIIR